MSAATQHSSEPRRLRRPEGAGKWRSWRSIDTFQAVFGFIYTVLRLNLALIITTAPLLVYLMLAAQPLVAYPMLIALLVISAPGIAAAFAAFRDAPGLAASAWQDTVSSTFEPESAGLRDGTIQASWWPESAGNAFFRPFFRAWRDLLGRVGRVALVLGLIALVLVVDLAVVSSQEWGMMLVPALVVAVIITAATAPIALVLAIELPKARLVPLLRRALSLAVRRWYLSLINVVVLATLGAGLILQPVLVAMLAYALGLYVVWAGARWAALPTITAVADGK